MEVILRDHVDNLGRRGEIVKVADGYARNYLLPRKLALPATEGNRKQVERERAKILPRRISGTCAMHQRKLRTAIMRARQLALIPYTAE